MPDDQRLWFKKREFKGSYAAAIITEFRILGRETMFLTIPFAFFQTVPGQVRSSLLYTKPLEFGTPLLERKKVLINSALD